MKKTVIYIFFFLVGIANVLAQNPKVVGDCTLTFSITGADPATNKDLAGAVKTFYVRGKISRVDISSATYQQSVIYNNTTGDAVILQEVGANKYMSHLTPEKWNQKNIRYQGVTFTYSADVKTILGYECKKGTALLKDGTGYTFYYTPTLTPSATENPYQFKDVPGLVLEYEIGGKDNASAITYTATKINFSPVPASKFEIPTSGYLVRDN
jgi:GLPGLI family protein